MTGSELEKADEGLGDLACLEIPIFHRNISNDRDETNINANELQMRQNLERKVSSNRVLFIQKTTTTN